MGRSTSRLYATCIYIYIYTFFFFFGIGAAAEYFAFPTGHLVSCPKHFGATRGTNSWRVLVRTVYQVVARWKLSDFTRC